MANNSNNKIPILHYFGANYCPYSNESSMLYNLINNNFTEKYGNVIIKIHMIDNPNNNDDEKDIIARANISVVPTITSSNYVHLEFTSPIQLHKNACNIVKAKIENGVESARKEYTDLDCENILIGNNQAATDTGIRLLLEQIYNQLTNTSDETTETLKNTKEKFSGNGTNNNMMYYIIGGVSLFVIILIVVFVILKKRKK